MSLNPNAVRSEHRRAHTAHTPGGERGGGATNPSSSSRYAQAPP